jgi:hypothetical protein
VNTPDIDAEKLRVLRHWGDGLRADDRTEVAAAGRAIVMLDDEVERLREQQPDTSPIPLPDYLEEPPPAGDEKQRSEFAAALRRRLTRESG